LTAFAAGLIVLVGCGKSDKRPAVEGGLADVEAYYALPPGAARRLGDLDIRHPGAVSASFSADGKTLITAGNTEFRVWDLATRKLVRRYLAASDTCWPLRSTPDGRFFVVLGDKDFRVVDQADGKVIRRITPTGQPRCFALSPDGKSVATGTWKGGEVRLWDVASARPLSFRVTHPPNSGFVQPDTLPEPPRPPLIEYVAITPDGKTVASAASNDVVRAWDARTGQELWHFDRPPTIDGPFAFSPDGQRIAVPTMRVDAKGKGLPAGLTIYRVKDRTTSLELEGGGFGGASNGAYCMAFSPDGRFFAAGGGDYRLRVWDAVTGKLRFTGATGSSISDVNFSPDSKTLVCVSAGVSLWDVETGRSMIGADGHFGSIRDFALSDDGQLLVTAGSDGTVRAWNTATGEQRWRTQVPENGGMPTAVALSPDEKNVATAGFDGIVRVLETATGREVRRTAKLGITSSCVAYTPDGKTLASGGANFTVHLWDAASGEEKGRFVGYDGAGLGGGFVFRFSTDGKTLVAPIRREPGWDGAARPTNGAKDAPGARFNRDLGPVGEADGKTRLALWDMASGKRLRVFGPPTEFGPADLAFSPDGGVLAFAAHPELHLSGLHLIDVRTGEEKSKFPTAGGRLAFKWDDRLFVGTECYDVATGKKLFEASASPRWLTAVSANGKVLVTAGGDDGTAVVWELAGGRSK
jgi:WD40 repeat protein